MTSGHLRVLFCFGINQNFFDLPRDGVTTADVWQATVSMMDAIKNDPRIEFIGDIDDDSHMVGPSDGWPWTFYLLCDVEDVDTVREVGNLLRTIPVGDSGTKLWKYAKMEARIGRALTPREYED